MTALEVAREYFPEASDDELDFIIWNQTGYPHFWSSPIPGDTPEDCFRLDLARLKWDLDNCLPTGLERWEVQARELAARDAA